MNKPVGTETTTQSSTQRAYLELRTAIITGKVQPGERLKVETLKETLQTGASPVREALSLLTSDQLVERLDQRGFRVAQTSRAQFQEILELRCNLEELGCAKALQREGRIGKKPWCCITTGWSAPARPIPSGSRITTSSFTCRSCQLARRQSCCGSASSFTI